MKISSILAVAGIVALTAACSRHEGTASYKYLHEVGLIRPRVNADDKERIPMLIRAQDYVGLRNVIEYKQTLAGIRTDGVDPEAVEYARSVDAVLETLGTLCADTGELLQKEHESHSGAAALATLRAVLQSTHGDTAQMVGSMLRAFNEPEIQQSTGAQFLRPYIDKIRMDRDTLMAARKAAADKAAHLREDFAQKYPDQDWARLEITPP